MIHIAIGLFAILAAAFSLQAQTTLAQADGVPAVVERGPHHRVWQTVSSYLDPNGETLWRTNSYTELQSGLCYQEKGQWVDASEEIELHPEGAVAQHTQHKVIFAPNLNTVGAIDLLTPDGKRMRSSPVGLAYYDAASGKSVWIGGLKDTQGALLGSNQVIYTNAFSNILATVRYTVSKEGFEQDIVLQEQPPTPEDFGLPSDTTRLEVVTEFYESPVPTKTALTLKHYTPSLGQAALAEPDFVDESLDFGTMFTGRGRAFKLSEQEDMHQGVPVGKRFGVSDGRTFMIEGVEYQAIRQQFSKLPKTKSAIRTAMMPAATQGRVFPPVQQTAKVKSVFLIAQSGPLNDTGVVIDYTLVVGGGSVRFYADTTYYVSGNAYFIGNLTLEGGCVIKYKKVQCTLNVGGNVITETDAARGVILTAADDDSVGEVISGSTGTPSGYYGNGIWVHTDSDLKYLYFRHLQFGISYSANHTNTISHSKFFNMDTALHFFGVTNSVRNVLFDHVACSMWFWAGTNKCVAENITASTSDWCFAYKDASAAACLAITNSLFAQCAFNGGVAFIADHCATNSSTNGVFQLVGASACYLADNAYRNLGTTNITASLLNDLRKKTTYPPTILSGTVSVDTVLIPQAQRDTDIPDYGYHYDPMDYMLCGLVVSNATVMMTNGVTVGVFGSGIDLRSGGALVSEGMPDNLNRLTRTQNIQDRGTNYTGQTFAGLITVTSNYETLPSVRMRFTDLPMVSGPRMDFIYAAYYMPLALVSLTDCTLWGGKMYLSAWNESRYCFATFTNSLFVRCNLTFEQPYSGGQFYYYFGLQSFNCNYKNCIVYFNNGMPLLEWKMYDNLFDTVTMGPTNNIYNANNAYLNTAQLAGGVSNIVLYSFYYAPGTYGPYYQWSTNLLNKGSRSATNAGLYYYTTQTNNVKEGGTAVDIGFHYIDANSYNYGDSDGDGLTDAYEILVSLTNPNKADSDGDVLTDGWEVLNSMNPNLDESQQTSRRLNYTYDKTGRLRTVSGAKGENIVLDSEGNVKQVP